MTNAELRDDQWKKIHIFLQQHPRVYVGREADCRKFVEAVLWTLRSGDQWRLIPENFGHWNRIYKRFRRWCSHQVWEDMHRYFVNDPDMKHISPDCTHLRARSYAARRSNR